MKVHQMPRNLRTLTLALLFLPAAGAWAQTGGAAAAFGSDENRHSQRAPGHRDHR